MGGRGAQIGGGGVGEGRRHCRWLLEAAGGRAKVLQMGGRVGWRKAGGSTAEMCWSRQAEGGDLGKKMEAAGQERG
jgi:hypothetical protein